MILAAELIIVLGGYAFAPQLASPLPADAGHRTRTNTAALGDILYTDYVYFFQIAGLVLLVAMIGAIVLTLRHKPSVKRQDISVQVARTRRPRSRSRRSRRGRVSDHGCRHRALSHAFGGPVHARRVRHLPEPQERHRHPDVGRAHPARGQPQLRRLLGPSAISSARCSRCSCSPSPRPKRRSDLPSSSSSSATAAPSRSKTST
jgi:hypothetical protein